MRNVSREPEKKSSAFLSAETFGMALILFSAVSVILLLLSDVLFGTQWFYTRFLFGAFGYCVFPLMAVLCYTGVMMVLGKTPKKSKWKAVTLISLLLFFAICIVHVLTASTADGTYADYIKHCYNAGYNGLAECTGGGVIFSLIVYPAVKYLTAVWSYVLFGALAALCLIGLVRLYFKKAVREASGRGREIERSVIGVKEYPDNDFDFNNSPTMQPVKNKLYFGSGSSDFTQTGKRDKRTNKDKALNILYPTAKSGDERGTVLNSGTMRDFSNKRTGDFSGRSYQSQYSDDLNRNSNRVRRPPVIEPVEHDEAFDRRSTVTEHRNVIRNHNEDRGADGFTGNLYSDRRQDRSFTDRSEDGDSRYSSLRDGRRSSFVRGDDTDDERASNRSEFTRSSMEEGNISESREERTPFDGKWDTPTERIKPERSVKEQNSTENIASTEPKREEKTSDESEVKKSNVTKFNMNPEKKAIYIEPDTGEAVMPEDEKKKADASVGETEQMPLMEQTEYIGIPEMPLRYKYSKPPIALYKDNPKPVSTYDDTVEERCRIIEKTLENFNVPARVENVVKGPTITRYEISIPEGITVSKVPPRASDLAMRLEVESVRIEAPIPGKNLIGIEVPNKVKEMVGMKELLLQKDFQKSSPDALSIVLGEDVVGNPVITDLTKTPHLLVAGATGMGKSVFLNALIMSLVTKYGPEDLRLVLVDPKQVEFTIYENLPHLLINQIITEASLCIGILDWAIDEMELRYKIFRSCYAQKIDEYNNAINPKTQRRMPKIVIIIDELGDLFSISSQVKHDIEDRIKRLTQKARAAGIHVVVATQRPDVTVITGVIKTNLPSRVAFKVLNYADSNTILNDGGADKLLGNGDMIFKTSNSALLKRIQGAYVSKDEIVRVLTYIKDNNKCYYDGNAKKYLDAKKASTQNAGTAASVTFGDSGGEDGDNGMFNNIPLRNLKALKIVIEKKQASISALQRSMSIGYSTAGRIIDWMEKMNYISKFEGSKAREVLITMEEFDSLYGEADLD